MKQRFSSLDVKVIAQELSPALCTLRLSNAYDLSSRIFLLKFAKPDNRQSLVIDTGFRCHLTSFSRTTASAPSAFIARLRKYLRTRRVTSVDQVGTDRIIELQFSDGQYRLFVEFYAGGNIILTDKELSILVLFRIVPEGPGQEELRVGLKYSLENRQNYHGVPSLTAARIRQGLQKTLEESVISPTKTKKKTGDALRKALARTLSEFPPTLLDHALRVANFDTATPVEIVVGNEAILQSLLLALEEAKRVYEDVKSSEVCKGFIIAKSPQGLPRGMQRDKESETPGEDPNVGLIYDDFQPFLPRQFEDDHAIHFLEFDTFNKAVDQFFSSVESQKLESRLTEREDHARKKLEAAKEDHQKRLGGLQQVQELNVRKAQAIEGNLQRVQEAIVAVNSLVAQGIGWTEIAQLIEMEQQRNNPVAEMIKLPLKLFEDTVTLLLAEADFEEDPDFDENKTDSDVSDSEDDVTGPSKNQQSAKFLDQRLTVDIDLALSPWSNARQYYDQKKIAAVKEQRTLQSSEKALKSTQRKINGDLQKGLKQEKDILRPQRKPMWFEKFVFFISSEGYMVIGGKDAQQNEILYKKYLKKGDTYVHANLPGAASIVVKNKPGRSNDPIPPSTLSQAGTLAVCTSSAWDSKAVMSAWWVHADQVSKTADGGEYLLPGNFTIKGQKNFLPPAQLLLGFGLMFKISEESKERHLKHRIRDDNQVSFKSKVELDKASNDPEVITAADESGAVEEEEKHSDPVEDSDETHTEEDEPDAKLVEYVGDKESSDSEDDRDLGYRNPLQNNYQRQSMSHENPSSIADVDSSGSDSEEGSQPIDHDADEGGFVPDDDERESSDSSNNDVPKGVRHLSARTRRLMRKGLQPDSEVDSQVSSTKPSTLDASARAQANSKPANIPQVRGKKGKRNRLKAKYADQDEEDRTVAMRLLGSSAAQDKVKEDDIAKEAKETELAAAKERRRKQHALVAERGKEAEERRKIEFEAEVSGLDEDDNEQEYDLEAFVGIPLPGDSILDALVVCGPWDAIGSRCKWRVKLQPGSLKKSKAVKEILGAWNAALKAQDEKKRPRGEDGDINIIEEDKLRKRETELIRTIREPEILGVVPVGKVRVMIGAGDRVSKARGGGAAGRGKRGGRGSKRK